MRWIMLTYPGEEHVKAWEAATPEERRLEVERTIAWFREHGAAGRIVGGEELGDARLAKTLRGRLVTDGPFAETKEQLGGFIVLEVADEAEAIRVAQGWVGLEWEGDAVELRPVGDAMADAGMR
jgi:hypothetical protein